MLPTRAIQPAEKQREFPAAPERGAGASTPPAAKDRMRRRNRRPREDGLSGFANSVLSAGLFGLALALIPSPGWTPAQAQGAPTGASPSRPWLDPAVLAAAQAEGSLIVYSSTNEQEGLPLFKLFTDATGIKVEYVRASDAILMSRMSIEFRADQKSYDIMQTSTINKMPPQMLAALRAAGSRRTSPPEARDPNKRWYGVYANYNSPAYNTKKVKASELPKSYEEFAQRKEWAGKVAIDGTDNEWLKAIVQYYGEQKGIDVVKAIVAALQAGGHRRPPRVGARDRCRRVLGVAQQLREPLDEHETCGQSHRRVGARSGRAVLRPGRRECQGAASERRPSRREFHAQPGMPAVPRQVRPTADAQGCAVEPARRVTEMLTQKKVITVLMSPDEERKWQRQFDQLFKGR